MTKLLIVFLSFVLMLPAAVVQADDPERSQPRLRAFASFRRDVCAARGLKRRTRPWPHADDPFRRRPPTHPRGVQASIRIKT